MLISVKLPIDAVTQVNTPNGRVNAVTHTHSVSRSSPLVWASDYHHQQADGHIPALPD
jgi:hypothetical protein